MEDPIDDLWEDLRQRPPLPPRDPPKPELVVVPEPSEVLRAELAAEITAKFNGRPFNGEFFADCILLGIERYFERNVKKSV